jgi:hypothetical protein
MAEVRLGDVIDDYCVKCRRLTNHSVVSIMNGEPAKVRCRTCYNEHDYRREEIPPSKREAKKKELFDSVLSTVAPESPSGEAEAEPEVVGEGESEAEGEGEASTETSAKPAKRTRSK